MSVRVIVRVVPVWLWPEWRLSPDFLEAFYLSVHLLKPASMGAFLLASWRIGADLGWTSEFIVADGILSHWQIWAVLGAAMISGESAHSKKLARNS